MAMLVIEPQVVPLRLDDAGTIRVGGTRVTLDAFLETYELEGSAEAVARELDVLDLADVYAVLAWCLHHRDEVAAYLSRREHEEQTIRSELESTQPSQPSFWEELRDRHARLGNKHAAPGQ